MFVDVLNIDSDDSLSETRFNISTNFCWECFGDLRFHTFMNFILL